MFRNARLILVMAFFAPISGCSQTPEAAKTVLVTGASTGIGRKITERLARDGYFVYAGARKDEDIKALNAIKNVRGIRLDVTKADDIDATVAMIAKSENGLYGLVNNAGVVTVGSVANTEWNEFDLVMAVNVYGPYRMTKAFAPMITKQRGRIINIGSISGILASPGLSAYTMSKHAMEAFTDSLSSEMAESGVKVSIIEPGDYASDIWKSASKRTGEKTEFTDRAKLFPEADDVAEAAEHALFDPQPKQRYMVVPNRKEADWVIKKQIEELVQLNSDQRYSFDRETLIKSLDEAIAKEQSHRD
jgi:NAD(P)-dependent dehydrogenase (short-subunit alcohol dehydrogenase family)